MKRIGLTCSSFFLIFLCFMSCEKKIFWNNKTTYRVNHYRQTCVGVGPRLCYLVQEEDNLTVDWSFFYSGFQGFTYEWGYVYDLKIRRRERISTPADASKYIYKLVEVIDRQKADPDEEFEINIVNHMDHYVFGDTIEGFVLFDDIEIDCGNLCQDLSIMLDTAESLSGVFKHKDAETIELVELMIT